MASEALDVCLRNRGGLVGELDREVAERSSSRLEVRLPVIVSGMVRKLVWGALVTEVVGVRASSVVALVLC